MVWDQKPGERKYAVTLCPPSENLLGHYRLTQGGWGSVCSAFSLPPMLWMDSFPVVGTSLVVALEFLYNFNSEVWPEFRGGNHKGGSVRLAIENEINKE